MGDQPSQRGGLPTISWTCVESLFFQFFASGNNYGLFHLDFLGETVYGSRDRWQHIVLLDAMLCSIHGNIGATTNIDTTDIDAEKKGSGGDDESKACRYYCHHTAFHEAVMLAMEMSLEGDAGFDVVFDGVQSKELSSFSKKRGRGYLPVSATTLGDMLKFTVEDNNHSHSHFHVTNTTVASASSNSGFGATATSNKSRRHTDEVGDDEAYTVIPYAANDLAAAATAATTAAAAATAASASACAIGDASVASASTAAITPILGATANVTPTAATLIDVGGICVEGGKRKLAIGCLHSISAPWFDFDFLHDNFLALSYDGWTYGVNCLQTKNHKYFANRKRILELYRNTSVLAGNSLVEVCIMSVECAFRAQASNTQPRREALTLDVIMRHPSTIEQGLAGHAQYIQALGFPAGVEPSMREQSYMRHVYAKNVAASVLPGAPTEMVTMQSSMDIANSFYSNQQTKEQAEEIAFRKTQWEKQALARKQHEVEQARVALAAIAAQAANAKAQAQLNTDAAALQTAPVAGTSLPT